MTSPIPGKAYEVFLAVPMTMSQCLKPVRWTIPSAWLAQPVFPAQGSDAPVKSPVDCFQRKVSDCPYCLPPVGGPERLGNCAVRCLQHLAGDSPYCLPRGGGPERPEKSPVDCFQRRAGGSPGRWPRSGRDEVVAPPAQRLYLKRIPCRRYYLAAGCRTDDLIRLLTNVRIHVMGHPVG